jgi:outer membrane protein assembly factor BamB
MHKRLCVSFFSLLFLSLSLLGSSKIYEFTERFDSWIAGLHKIYATNDKRERERILNEGLGLIRRYIQTEDKELVLERCLNCINSEIKRGSLCDHGVGVLLRLISEIKKFVDDDKVSSLYDSIIDSEYNRYYTWESFSSDLSLTKVFDESPISINKLTNDLLSGNFTYKEELLGALLENETLQDKLKVEISTWFQRANKSDLSYNHKEFIDFLNSSNSLIRDAAFKAFLDLSVQLSADDYEANRIFDYFFCTGVYYLLDHGYNEENLYKELYKFYKSKDAVFAIRKLLIRLSVIATDAEPVSSNDSSDWIINYDFRFTDLINKLASDYFNVKNISSNTNIFQLFNEALKQAIQQNTISREQILQFILAGKKWHLDSEIVMPYVANIICDTSCSLTERVNLVNHVITYERRSSIIDKLKQGLEGDLRDYLLTQLEAYEAKTDYERFVIQKKLTDLSKKNPNFHRGAIAYRLKNIYEPTEECLGKFMYVAGYTATRTKKIGNQIYVIKNNRINVFDVETGYLIWNLKLPEAENYVFADGDCNYVFVGTDKGNLLVIDSKTGNVVQKKHLDGHKIHCISVKDDRVFVECGDKYRGDKVVILNFDLQDQGSIECSDWINYRVVTEDVLGVLYHDYNIDKLTIYDSKNYQKIDCLNIEGRFFTALGAKFFFTSKIDNRLYFVCYDAFEKKLDWSYELKSRLVHNPVISENGDKVFILLSDKAFPLQSITDKALLALSTTKQDSQLLWEISSKDERFTYTRKIDQMIKSHNNSLWAINEDSGEIYSVDGQTGAISFIEKAKYGRTRILIGERDEKPIVLGQSF